MKNFVEWSVEIFEMEVKFESEWLHEFVRDFELTSECSDSERSDLIRSESRTADFEL